MILKYYIGRKFFEMGNDNNPKIDCIRKETIGISIGMLSYEKKGLRGGGS